MKIATTYCKRIFFLLLSLVYCGMLHSQLSIDDIKDQGDSFYKEQRFYKALEYYDRVLSIRADADIDPIKLGVTYLYTNKLYDARTTLIRAINDDQDKDLAYYYLARVAHREGKFNEAIKFFKLFLQRKGPKHKLSTSAIEYIKRCDTGAQLEFAEQFAFIENLGRDVNTVFDERKPLPSPNVTDKIYFYSNREGNRGGPQDERGEIDRLNGSYRSDMLTAELRQGLWTGAQSLNPALNTRADEFLLGFQNKGAILHFIRKDFNNERILIDTFHQDGLLHLGNWEQDLGIETEGGIQFFNDTTLLFSSRFLEGYGGYDLYISKLREGVWTTPQNLGPIINTPYDEVHPFLTPNGRSLYFSSNNTRSIGGYDIFETSFTDAQNTWSEPVNLRTPINSPDNDIEFTMSSDGIKAYFSSDRAESQGGYDLYNAYFKQTRAPQFVPAQPISFDLTRSTKASNENTVSTEEPTARPADIFREFELSPIYYGDNDYMLDNANKKIIDRYVNLLRSYPSMRMQLTAHSDGTDPDQFDEYFCVKRAEKLTDYLRTQGISPGRIIIRGVGDHYPVVDEKASGGVRLAKRLHRRIDVDLLDVENIPIQIKKGNIDVPQHAAVANNLTDKESGLSYRVIIARTSQPYTNNRFTEDADPMVKKLATESIYVYSVGIYKNYFTAESIQATLKSDGYRDARVVAYIDGKEYPRSTLTTLAEKYPDLNYYLENN